MRVFLDAAVFVQTWDLRPAEAKAREAAFELLERIDLELVTSSLIVGQVFSAIWKANRGADPKERHKRSAEAALQVVPLSTLSVGTREISGGIALAGKHKFQLWDAVNWTTARFGECEWYASFYAPGNPRKFNGVKYFDVLNPPV